MKLEVQSLEVDEVAMPDLRELKELSEKLQLSTTRESVIQWHNDLKDLQSEGIYPITSKPTEASIKGISGILQQASEDTLKSSDTEYKVKCEQKLNNEEEEAEARDVVSSQFPSVKLRNFKKKSKMKMSAARRSVSLRTDSHGNVLPSDKKSASEAVQFFRQRTPQYCQDRILKYINSDENAADDVEIDATQVTLAERYRRIGKALEKIRRDLLDMRIQDNTLARQLLDGRHELNQVRAEKTWDEHANMLDDFSWELELEDDIKEQLRLFDLPSNLMRKPDSLLQSSSPLRVIGLSRMTMDSRRFSVI